ncbi:hypothetical protein [Glycomyces terrestris]|uniref:hypothetical protein n=1 Tax=Glycomyces terrestris TaxID=2493553 RepID=UPI0018D4DE64|nr:hypothetical protein [Glycomyces terrestris]
MSAAQDYAAGVDAIAAVVLAVPGVAGLHGGARGEVAVLLPGRRVPGLRLDDTACEVHVAVHWGTDIPRTAAAIRAAVAPLAPGRPVAVTVEDIDPWSTAEDIDLRSTEEVDRSGTVEGVDIGGTVEGVDIGAAAEDVDLSGTTEDAGFSGSAEDADFDGAAGLATGAGGPDPSKGD